MKNKIICLIILILLTNPALAKENILTSAISLFSSNSSNWGNIITNTANYLFFSLGLISFVWTMGTLLLKRAEIGDFFSELIRFTIFFGVMYWLLINTNKISFDIINSFILLTSNAGGNLSPITALSIFEIGLNIFLKIISLFAILHPIDNTALFLIGLSILIFTSYIAVSFILLQISAYILINIGVFVLGFGGTKWTSQLAINYYKVLIKTGLKLFIISLIITLEQNILFYYSNLIKIQQDISFENLAIILLTVIFSVMLIRKVTQLIAELISGELINLDSTPSNSTENKTILNTLTTTTSAIEKIVFSQNSTSPQLFSSTSTNIIQTTTPNITNIINPNQEKYSSQVSYPITNNLIKDRSFTHHLETVLITTELSGKLDINQNKNIATSNKKQPAIQPHRTPK